MSTYEQMLDKLDREIRSTSPDEWTDADIIIRIREIEEDERIQAERDGTELPEPLSEMACERIVNKLVLLHTISPRAGGSAARSQAR